MAKFIPSNFKSVVLFSAAWVIVGNPLAVSQTQTTAEPKAPQSAAPAPSPKASLEGENLLFAPPKDFKIGYHADHDSMTEWVPNGQTVENWTEMLTIQIFRNLKGADAAAFLQNVGTKYLMACPDTPKDTIRTGNVNGYVVSMLVLKCPKNPNTGKSETTVFRAIKGKDAVYFVQHAWKTVPSNDAMQALSKSAVCDTRDPGHPCPPLNPLAPPD